MAVLGIGGLFFRAQDPEALTAWYKEHLQIGPGCAAAGAGDADDWSWLTLGGPTVFTPFPADTEYFARDKTHMLNLRVSGLAEMIERLTSEGIAVTTKPEWNHPDVGNFARVHDPEGNPIELWEPPQPKP